MCQMNTPPSCRGVVPVSQVKNAIIRSWLRMGPTIIVCTTFQLATSPMT